MHLLSLAFGNERLEQRYAIHRAGELSNLDKQVHLMNASLWLWGTVWLVLSERSFVRSMRALAAALQWLFPCLLHWRSPEVYAHHRRQLVIVIRLAAMLLGSDAMQLNQVYSGARVQSSRGSILGLLAIALQIRKGWTLSVGLRLDFSTHLLLQALLAARFVLVQAKLLCMTPSMQDPAVLRQFWDMSRRLTQWAGLLVPLADWWQAFNASGPSTWQCFAVTSWAHFIFTFFLPTVVVYVTERLSRRDFLTAQAAAAQAGGATGLAQASQQLGLSEEEVLSVCVFDPVASGTGCLGLLGPLAAAAWLGAVTLSGPLGLPLAPWKSASYGSESKT